MGTEFLKEGHRFADPPVLGEDDKIHLELKPGGLNQVKPKRKYRKRRKRKGKLLLNEVIGAKRGRPKKEVLPEVDLAGIRRAKMGGNGCPVACTAAGCVITGEICGHPDLGGLQPKYLNDPVIKRRFDQAVLALKRLDAEQGK